MASGTLPTRTTMSSEDDPTAGEDTSETSKLFQERLAAWRHACAYLSDYVQSTEKAEHSQAKEYEKVLKTISSPLKEGDHFAQTSGGVGEMFDSLRTNTQNISNSHSEASRSLKSVVLPIFDRLESEIKAKQKELKKGVGKGSKAVDKARATTQKHIDLLGQQTHTYDSSNFGKAKPDNDPYIIQKGVYHRLNNQLEEENSTRQDMIGVQNNFASFEAHVVQTFQQGIAALSQTTSAQADQKKAHYSAMVQSTQKQNPVFEWNSFLQRRGDVLIDPNASPRTLQTATFANQNHHSTKAMVEGQLERKHGLLKKWDTGFYAVTPSKFLHEFKSDDVIAKDPSPELSIHLPDATIGALNGNLFSIKGKDLTSKMSLHNSKEYEFRARSSEEAETWYGTIKGIMGLPATAGASSPVSSRSNDKSFDQQDTPTRSQYQQDYDHQQQQSPTQLQGFSQTRGSTELQKTETDFSRLDVTKPGDSTF